MVLPALAAGASRLLFGTAARAGVTGVLSGLALDDVPLIGGLFDDGGGGHGGGGPGGLVMVVLVGLGAAVVGGIVALFADDGGGS